MELHGTFMEVPLTCHVSFMDIHGSRTEDSWELHEVHENSIEGSWKFMGVYGSSWMFTEVSWKFMGVHVFHGS